MKAPLRWLADYVDLPPDLDELTHRLIMSGTEVDDVIRLGDDWDGIVVGQVAELERPPGSKHLSVARVAIAGRTITAVTGAPNIAVGQRVPVALIGGTVPVGPEGAPFVLKPRPMMGITGDGMVLSERELGISQEHAGILVLPATAPVGVPLDQVLGGVVLDVEAKGRTDELAILGVAREIAAVTGRDLREPDTSRPGSTRTSPQPSAVVRVEAPDLCPRFSVIRVDGVSIGPSPHWLAARLEAAGVRAINNVVDVTNYVMLELGQPLHAYDGAAVPNATFIVRRAHPDETIVTLDGVNRPLSEHVVVVADTAGPSGIGGVMGGGNSEVTEQTTSVLLEAANWDRVNIRRTSRSLGLRTEASARFERGVPPELTTVAIDRCLHLFARIMDEPLTVHGMVDVGQPLGELPVISFQMTQISRLLGTDVPQDGALAALARLGFEVAVCGDDLSVRPPFWRRDVEGIADVAEEIARMIGYDMIPETLPGQETQPVPLPPDMAHEGYIRAALWGVGLSEAWTDTLVAPESPARLFPFGSGSDHPWERVVANPEGIGLHGASAQLITLANAPSRERSTLRLSLVPSLLDVAAGNLKHTRERVAFFELARTFFPRHQDLPYERRTLGIVMVGNRHSRTWNRPAVAYDFFDVKGLVELVVGLFAPDQSSELTAGRLAGAHPALHPGRGAAVMVGDRSIGYLGELHPLIAGRFEIEEPVRAQVAELDLDTLFAGIDSGSRQYFPVSRFPAVKRDISLIFPAGVEAAAMTRTVRSTGGDLLRRVTVVDVFEGEGVGVDHRSVALGLEFQAESGTLTQEVVTEIQDRIVAGLAAELGGVLRA